MIGLTLVLSARTGSPAAGRGEPVVSRSAQTRGYRVFQAVNGVVLTAVVVLTLFPFVNILARSFSGEQEIRAGQVNLWPRGFNLTTYERVMSDAMFWTNYRNTVVYTVVATAISMVLTTCYAYVLSKQHLQGRGLLVGIAVFTMFFNGGLIPNYVLVSSLGLRNTLWAIVLPNAINVFNLLVMKAFFESLPIELEEAASVDGSTTYGILWRIVLPLSKAVLATMMLFYAVVVLELVVLRLPLHGPAGAVPGHRLPAQPHRRRHRRVGPDHGQRHRAADRRQHPGGDDRAHRAADHARLPFIQRYFVSGVMLGAVKG